MKLTEKIDLYLNERNEDVVYFTNYTLWVAYGPNSGTTAIIKNTKSYITDKPSDDHYDSIVHNILEFTKKTKPMKKKGDSKLYEVDVYYDDNNHENFKIWGGEVKPQNKKYMVVNTGKITVINFFDNKKEAISWLNTSIV